MKKMNELMVLGLSLTLWLSLGCQAGGGEEQWVQGPADKTFFNGKDLTGFKAVNMEYYSVKDGAIVGTYTKPTRPNQFLWSGVEVADFYLAMDVKQVPVAVNAGIQFRSRPRGASAQGYQADVGQAIKGGHNIWGSLYEEHGRHLLVGNPDGSMVNEEGWNRYEILAVGHHVWLALNKKVICAIHDPNGALKGQIGLQIHAGPAQTVWYRPVRLVHNPKIAIAGLNEKEAMALIKPLVIKPKPKKVVVPKKKPAPKK